MGNPKVDAKAYEKSDAISDAAKIADPLLLVHGMADDNVVFENSTAFAAKMQATNRPFEMMFYPGKTHAAARDIHVWTTIFNYFDRVVKNRPPR
jgi:dipeptidyl-peptidase-4